MKNTLEMPRRSHHSHHHHPVHHTQHHSRKSSRSSALPSPRRRNEPALEGCPGLWNNFLRIILLCGRGNRIQEQVQQNREGSGSNQGSLASENSFARIRPGMNAYCATQPTWSKGRKFQMAQMIILPFIPIMALICQNILSLMSVLEYQSEVTNIDKQVETTLSLGKFVTEIQKERSEVSFYVFTDTNYLGSNLSERFEKTDDALRNLAEWPAVKEASENSSFASKEIFHVTLRDFRLQLTPNDSNISEVMGYYNQINDAMLTYLTQEIKETNTSHLWRFLVSYKNILRSIENVGISVVYGVNYFGRGNLSPVNYIKYVRYDTLGTEYLNSSLEFSYFAKQYYYTQIMSKLPTYGDIKNSRKKILINSKEPPNLEEAMKYYQAMSDYIDALRGLQIEIRIAIRQAVEQRLRDADESAAITILILILVLIISPLIIFLVHKSTSTIQLFAYTLMVKADELRREKKKSDRLLFQMLPSQVAQELKQKRQVQAQYYEQVTVYFSDIVGFTEIASESSPLEVVTFLNSIYKLFDARIERYDVYKVETIGDSYMVASGLPKPNGDLHITEIATMALDLLAGSVIFQIPHRPGEKLQIRIGIHTGAAVAGVVGTKMPRYCLFGDTVNTASRMESTGEPLRIHISMEMKLALDVVGGFKTESRGLIEVKGKGMMETYWLCGKDGGVGRSVELETPGFFESTYQPAFMADVDESNAVD